MSKDPRDNYGPPLEDLKQKIITGTTAKQVLQTTPSKEVITGSSSSSQNHFTPLLSPRPRPQLASPAVLHVSSLISPIIRSQLALPSTSPSSKMI